MKFTYREIVLGLLLIGVCVAWFIDRQRQRNLAAAAQRQMDRYYWQSDKLTGWIEKQENVRSIDVNVDTITINHADGQSNVFSRKPRG